jgi:hypothetical protein
MREGVEIGERENEEDERSLTGRRNILRIGGLWS